jgi:hypothetical protein
MKNCLLTLLASFFAFLATAQESPTRPDVYLSTGLSISNSYDATFAYSSYVSLEGGIMKNNFSLGLVAGRSNLSGFGSDDISNYWYEVKTAVSFPLGKFSGYGLLGVGNYISTKRIFVEYGGGFSYMLGRFGIYAQASNWDGTWYVTPGVSYTF